MPKQSDEVRPLSVFATNLIAVIAHEAAERKEKFSVNAWAVRHKITQTTINRIVTGNQDPSTEMIDRIAQAAKLSPWQMFVPGLNMDHPPAMQDPNQRELLDRLKSALSPPPAQAVAPTPPAHKRHTDRRQIGLGITLARGAAKSKRGAAK